MIVESEVLKILRKYDPSIMLGSPLAPRPDGGRCPMMRDIEMKFSVSASWLSGIAIVKDLCHLIRSKLGDQPMEDRVYQVIVNEVVGASVEPSTKLRTFPPKTLEGVIDVIHEKFGVKVDLEEFEEGRTLESICLYVATALELDEINLPEEKMNNMKFYMNNPCKVLRSVGENLSEVEVYPKFAESMSGGEWCMECLSGPLSHSHTCDMYQEVIDAVNGEATSMAIIVENRLLHDEPVEFAKYRKVQVKTEELVAKGEKAAAIAANERYEAKKNAEESGRLKGTLIRYQETIAGLQEETTKCREELAKLQSLIPQEQAINEGHGKVNISVSELRELLLNAEILRLLMERKVDRSDYWDFDLDSEIFLAEAIKNYVN